MSISFPSPARPADHDPAMWRAGVKAGAPTLFGIAAWGMVVGVAMIKSGLSIPQALGMTLLVFAGSAQLASLPLIFGNAPIWVVFATALVVNLRFVIFSALLAPHFSHLPWKQRLALGYVSGDMTVAIFLQRFPDETPVAGKVWRVDVAGTGKGVLNGNAVHILAGKQLWSFLHLSDAADVAGPLLAEHLEQVLAQDARALWDGDAAPVLEVAEPGGDRLESARGAHDLVADPRPGMA